MPPASRKRARGASSAAAPAPTPTLLTLADPALACPAALVGLWREGAHVDLHLSAGGRRFGVHRIVAAAGSLYMRARLGGEWADSRTDPSLDAAGIAAATLEAVLEFLYTGSCQVAAEGVAPSPDRALGQPP